MPLSIITYNQDPDLSAIRSVQAADPVTMEKRLNTLLAEFAALNEDIPDPEDKWVPGDANLAGGGDGHTFIFTVTMVRSACLRLTNVLIASNGGILNENALAPFGIPALENFFTKFVMASEAEALDFRMNKIRKELIKQSLEVPGAIGSVAVWQQIAGASQGTRFMGGISALIIAPPAPPG